MHTFYSMAGNKYRHLLFSTRRGARIHKLPSRSHCMPHAASNVRLCHHFVRSSILRIGRWMKQIKSKRSERPATDVPNHMHRTHAPSMFICSIIGLMTCADRVHSDSFLFLKCNHLLHLRGRHHLAANGQRTGCRLITLCVPTWWYVVRATAHRLNVFVEKVDFFYCPVINLNNLSFSIQRLNFFFLSFISSSTELWSDWCMVFRWRTQWYSQFLTFLLRICCVRVVRRFRHKFRSKRSPTAESKHKNH